MEMDNINKNNTPEVRILKDGPILLKGFFRFTDSSGSAQDKEMEVYFCRCGGSGNKPYCDDTHKKIGVKN